MGAVQLRTGNHHVIVVHPSQTAPTDVADLTWTRVASPAMTINRVVAAGGHTFALGTTHNGTVAIGEIGADGLTSIVYPAMDRTGHPATGAVTDLVGVPGALIAVGQTTGAGPSQAGGWRSTDGGRTWQGGFSVEAPHGYGIPTLSRVVVSRGVVYAFGTIDARTTSLACDFLSVWTSSDGIDFRLEPRARFGCAVNPNATDGPAGILVTTSDPGTAWTDDGGGWAPHPISTEEGSRVLDVTGDDHSYIAVGSTTDHAGTTTAAIWSSADGISWSRVATDSVAR